jgi:hypothetical protein
MIDESRPGEKSRWTMMVAGDESPLITANAPSGARTGGRGSSWLYSAVAMLGAAAVLAARRIGQRVTP